MKIHLNSVRLYAYHGVMEQERRVGGDYEVTLSVTLPDDARALERDELDGTVNYAALYDIICREMAVPAALLEHVAWRIGKAVRTAYPQVQQATVSVTKLTPPLGADSSGATVTVEL